MIQPHKLVRAARHLVIASFLLFAACKGKPKSTANLPRLTDSTADSLAARTGVITRNGEPPQLIEYTATDGAYQGGMRSIVNGQVALRFTNRGHSVHELRFLRISRPDVTLAQIVGFIRGQQSLPERDLVGWGGAGPLAPGRTMTATQFFQPGDYLIVNTLLAPDGQRWFTEGMIDSLHVTGNFDITKRVVQPAKLVATGTLQTNETTWRFGSSLTRGRNTSLLVEGRNRRTQLVHGPNVVAIDNGVRYPIHDVVILRGTEPRAMRQYIRWVNGDRSVPVPDVVGGIPAFFPLSKSYLSMDLDAGPYLIFCPVLKGPRGDDRAAGFEVGEYDQFVVK
jgi:hypothetical protein